MKLVAKQYGFEIWAQFDTEAKVYELFYDNEGESFTGWNADSLKDAAVVAKHILSTQEQFKY